MIVRRATGDARTSLAAEPELADTELACFHLACYESEFDAIEP